MKSGKAACGCGAAAAKLGGEGAAAPAATSKRAVTRRPRTPSTAAASTCALSPCTARLARELGGQGDGEHVALEGGGPGVAQEPVERHARRLHALQDQLPGALDALHGEVLHGVRLGLRGRRVPRAPATRARPRGRRRGAPREPAGGVAGRPRRPGRPLRRGGRPRRPLSGAAAAAVAAGFAASLAGGRPGTARRRRSGPGRAGLEAPQALLEGGRRVVQLRPRDLDERELELQPRVEPVTDLALRLSELLDEEDDLARRDLAGALQLLAEQLVVELDGLSERAQRGLVARRLLQVLEQEELAQVAQQVADELRVVGALVGQPLHELQRLGGVALDDDVGDLEEEVAAGDAERLEHVLGRDGALGVRDELVQRADRVAEPALRVARDDVQRLGLDVDGRPAPSASGRRSRARRCRPAGARCR